SGGWIRAAARRASAVPAFSSAATLRDGTSPHGDHPFIVWNTVRCSAIGRGSRRPVPRAPAVPGSRGGVPGRGGARLTARAVHRPLRRGPVPRARYGGAVPEEGVEQAG